MGQKHDRWSSIETHVHEADVCIVGGGMAGVGAAWSASRAGAKVVLIQNRPMLGGNASSECRIHICGADQHNKNPLLRETGLLENIRMENLHTNPHRSYTLRDSIIYRTLKACENLTILLNCSVQEAEMDSEHRIASVTGYQLTTEIHHTVKANVFIDCSGDGVLAPLTGAAFMCGRDGKDAFGEALAPSEPNEFTMGMTCLFQAREYDTPQPFTRPDWANEYPACDDLPCYHGHLEMGYWWVELGGSDDSIRDTESLRDELQAIAVGVWDHLKNHCPETKERATNWALQWLQFLPAKRESRRYVGLHILTETELEKQIHFEDLVAYGGWEMDDHSSLGFKCAKIEPSTNFHPTPAPYGIPLGSLIHRDVENLMFAGRCHSATHMAMSGTRVMATGMMMGHAAGTAAALACRESILPKETLGHIPEIQQSLLSDDIYIPWTVKLYNDVTMSAELKASNGLDPSAVRDGTQRPVDDEPHAWAHNPSDSLEMRFSEPVSLTQAVLVVETDFMLDPEMSHHHKYNRNISVHEKGLTPRMPKTLMLEASIDGEWQEIARIEKNFHRQVIIPLPEGPIEAIRYTLLETWGAPEAPTALYAMYVE